MRLPLPNYAAVKILLLPALLALLVPGCGQKLSYDSELSTQVVELKDVIKCRHLGNTRLSVPPKLYTLGGQAKMARDLLVKARNLAAEVGADTVVPINEVREGKQNFRMYVCNTTP